MSCVVCIYSSGVLVFFFFKQKTEYEMRIREWSSDVCSSDLLVKFPNIESSTYANTYIVGESIYIKQLFESTGVDPQTGLYTFRDFDANELITDEDRKNPVFIGYDFFGGMNNAFQARKSVVSGKRTSVRVDVGCRR